MLRAAVLAFEQLSDRTTQRLVVRCVLLALATFVLLVVAVAGVLALLQLTGIAWLDTTIAVAGSGLALILAWLLFPVVVALTLNFFAEEVAEATERRHHPDLPPARGLSFADSTLATARFTAIAVLLNLLALPFYLVPGANVLLYLALNGYLLGREYFELVAQRRLPLGSVAALRRRQRLRIGLAGVAIAALLAVPFVNLVGPVVATAFMVHLFERWSGTAANRMPAKEEGGAVAVPPTGDRSV